MITEAQVQSLGAQLGILTDRPFTVTDLDLYCSLHDLVLEYVDGHWVVFQEDMPTAITA